MKNRNFLSVAEKRKFEKFANDTAIHEARKLGGNEFAEAIEGLSTDQAANAEVRHKARELATSRFSPQEVAAAYELLYEEIHG